MTHRRNLALALAALSMAAIPAQAQPGGRSVQERLRECGRIADIPARVACYDAIPTDDPQPVAAPGPVQEEALPTGFGSRQLAARSIAQQEPDSLEATVSAAVQRQPGIYLLTLDDGAQWQFVEGVLSSYNPPRQGSKVEIRTASVGSYLLRYQDQAAVRIRRVR